MRLAPWPLAVLLLAALAPPLPAHAAGAAGQAVGQAFTDCAGDYAVAGASPLPVAWSLRLRLGGHAEVDEDGGTSATFARTHTAPARLPVDLLRGARVALYADGALVAESACSGLSPM